MTFKLTDIGWMHGIDGIEEQMKKYGRRDTNGITIAYYPNVNHFESVDAYESYVDVLIKSTKRELAASKKMLKRLTIAYVFAEGEALREMNFVRFVFNLIMWRPFIVSKISITEADIFNPETFYNSKYSDYIDRFADMYRDRFTMAEFSSILCDMQTDMNKFAVSVGFLFGHSNSIYDMLMMAKKYKEIDEIVNTQIDLDNFVVKEAEEYLKKQTNRLMNILVNASDKNNPLKPFIRAKTGVNTHQVQESYVHLGFKPNLDGHTIPSTTNSNLMGEGLKTPQAVFTDAKGGRKAALLQKGVGDAGYFGQVGRF